ncbi:hypothetical protein HDV00_003266 [Rhizophlyctis rosea]|nr:hypothetical protein HDV00_003266 [Rhizophlyctis rosea]
MTTHPPRPRGHQIQLHHPQTPTTPPTLFPPIPLPPPLERWKAQLERLEAELVILRAERDRLRAERERVRREREEIERRRAWEEEEAKRRRRGLGERGLEAGRLGEGWFGGVGIGMGLRLVGGLNFISRHMFLKFSSTPPNTSNTSLPISPQGAFPSPPIPPPAAASGLTGIGAGPATTNMPFNMPAHLVIHRSDSGVLIGDD